MLKYFSDPRGNLLAQKLLDILPPQITNQPVIEIAAPGEIVTFSVLVADASGITFQWKFNGTDIPSATGDSLLLINVSTANQGQYSVVVTNSGGSVTSATASLLLDSDGDGLPDSWETANFSNTTSQRSEGDPDADRVSNIDEFFDGTNPNSKDSLRPRLIAYSDSGGSVTVSPMKLSYDLGETVTLTATPIAPSVFVGWDRDLNLGDLISTTNPVTITIKENKTVRARFASAVPLPRGLIAFWRGETDASDLIGGHNGNFFIGTTQTTPSVTPSGKVGGCFTFDGSVYIQIPDAVELRPSEITVEGWFFPTLQSSAFQGIIASGSRTSENDTWALALINGKLQFFSNHVGSGVTSIESPSTIPLNEWTHFAMSFDGMTRRLYVNAAQVASQSSLGKLVYEPSVVPVTIGSDWASNASSSRFNGRVDEVALYNRALTINEIFDTYNADFVGKDVTRPYFTSPSLLSDVALGASYSQQLTTILGVAPISFSLIQGFLPPNSTLSLTGLVSGHADVAGTFDFTVLATDAAGKSTEQLCALRVLQLIALPTDMLDWWRAEPAMGSVVPDIIGSHDGGFFRGNAAADPSYTPDGKVGNAFAFDGALYVRVPDATTLRPDEMTAEAWVFPTVQSGNQQTAIASGSATQNEDAWWMGILNGRPRFSSKHLGFGMDILDSPSAISLNQWTHLAITFDGTTKQLYVNGVEVASKGGLSTLIYDSTAVPVTIGANWARNAPTDFFNGRLDEVSLYRRALSADEIFRIADAGSTGKSTVGPYITSPSRLTFAIVGQAFSHTFASVRETVPIAYAISAGSTLPSGLTLSSTGVLSGTPANQGNFTFAVRVTDAAGLFYDQPCTLRVFESVLAPTGLIGWWRAEGNAQDSAGTNQGTLRNGAGFSVGKVGQAFLLNGRDGFVEIPDAPALRPTSLTLEAWVAFDTTSGIRVIFAKPVGTGTSDSYALFLQNGTIQGVVGDAAGIGPILSAPSALSPGHLYHLVYTFDDGAKQQALYVDGIQVAVGAASKSAGYDTQPLLLGRDTESGVPNFFLQGRIDEASIYNRALNLFEIASIYNAGAAGKRLI